MNIDAEAGTKVVYLGENGYDYQREKIEALGVKVGDLLTVSYVDVREWITYVEFEEIDSMHNSEMFKDI
jgi:hypothetical protein